MANTDKDIVIRPNKGSSTMDPQVVFSGANASLGPQNITLRVYPENNGTLSFEGSAGQVFSITNSLSGTIFSVNDVSGIPSIEVLDNGFIKLAQYFGNVVLGSGIDNGTDKLQVNGSISGTIVKGSTFTSSVATGIAPLSVTSTTLVSNLNANFVGGLPIHTGRNNEANRIVRTDGNGYIQAGWINTLSGDNGTTAINRVYASHDEYIRYYTPANFRTVLDVPTRTGGNASGTWNINITGSAGSISGFNNPTTAPTANTIVYRDSNGDIAAREIVLSSGLSSATPTVLVSMFPTTNQLVRTTPTAVAAAIQSAATGNWGINITGNAATSTSADQIDGVPFRNSNASGPINANTLDSNGITYYTSGVDNFSGNSNDGALYSQAYSSAWQHQIAGDYREGNIAVRGKNNGTWARWKPIPTLTISDNAPANETRGDLWWESDTGKLKIYYDDGNSSQWVDAVPIPDLTIYYSKAGGAISGPVVCQSSLTTNILTSGGPAIGGTVTGAWTLTNGSTWQATFADLAEWYTSDQDYEYGTVVVFGGEYETTISSKANDTRVAGVISKDPAFVMNVDLPGPSACIALQGRVPVKVIGRVSKGDLLVTSDIPGVAMANNNAAPYTVIGKAIENKDTEDQDMIFVSVGR
jgi:hypothetical protein